MNEWKHCISWFQDKCNDYSNCEGCKRFIPLHQHNCLECDKLKGKIITLCGSTKFKKQYLEKNKELTLKGHIVLSVSCFGHADNLKIPTTQKRILDAVHLKKIQLSDAIYIIDVGGYIGESTKSEIEFAKDNLIERYYYSNDCEPYIKCS